MNPRTTVWLALAALVLGAFIYLFEIRGGEERDQAESRGKRLFPELVDARIDRLSLTTSDGHEVDLERISDEEGDAGWKLTAPVAAPASEGAVAAILTGLEEIERESEIPMPEDLEPFGLGDGAPRLRFEGTGLKGELILGGTAPVGASRYVLMPGGSRIDLVHSFRLNAFGESLDDLRDKRVLPFATATVHRARFSWPGTHVVVERRAGGWWLREPIEGPANASMIDTLLADLAYLRAEGFIDEAVEPRALGLDAPAFAAVLEVPRESDASDTETGDSLQIDFAVGDVLDSDEGRRSARGRSGMLYQIASERLEDWPRRVVDYRDKTVSQFDVSAARTFELVFFSAAAEPHGEEAAMPLVRIQAELADAGWVAGPEPMAPGRAAALIAALARLEGIDIVADAMGDDERGAIGLRPAAVSIRVWGGGESGAEAPLLAELSIGAEAPRGGFFAKRQDADIVYLIDAALASEIPVSLVAFRESFGAEVDDPIGDPLGEDLLGEGEGDVGTLNGVPEI